MLVSYQWLNEHINDQDLVIIDTRPKVAYMYGHIPNSFSLTVEQMIKVNKHGAHLVPEPQDASQLLGSLGIDNTKTVVITGEAMDPSVTRIAWTLMYLGHENTKILDIGISAWQSLGMAITRAQKNSTPTQFTPKIKSEIRMDTAEMQSVVGKVTVLDARTPQEYFGGHIPYSTLVPFTDGMGQGGFLFDKKESLQTLFAQKRIPPDNDVVCYCSHGHRASSLFFQLKIAGYQKVRVYDGSFVDWYSQGLALE